ncbi:hypothetical protein BX666DRAFT_1877478 [Dichotomocladium elegans]|nr:hypothetical protein BX666DRAFT_1877478 [Dichotomocladium elegans]
MFDIPWQFGYGGLLIYVVNIAESIAHSRNSGKGLPFSPFTVDTLGLFLFIVPFVVNNALNIASGAIHRTHLYAAETLQRLLYLSWTLCTGALAAAAVYFGIWVIRFLNARAHMSQTSGMILKLQVAVISFAICLAGFAIFLGIYGASRDRIMANPIGNMILAIVWNYWGTFGSLFAMLAVTLRTIPGLVNSKLRDPAYPDPREEGTTTVEDTCFGGQTTLGAVTTRFQNDYDAIFHAIKKGRGLDVGKHSWKRLHVDHDSDILELEIAYHPNK